MKSNFFSYLCTRFHDPSLGFESGSLYMSLEISTLRTNSIVVKSIVSTFIFVVTPRNILFPNVSNE